MKTPEMWLSPSERIVLTAIVGGAEEAALDWVAVQRLKQFGLIEETSQGHMVTAEGRRALASGREP